MPNKTNPVSPLAAGTKRPPMLLRWGRTDWARAHADILLPAIGSFRTHSSGPVAAVLACCGYSQLTEEVNATLANHKPQSAHTSQNWPSIKEFTRDACSLAAPTTPYTASLLMTVAIPFVAWCVNEQGLPMTANVVFSRQAIDAYVTLENKGRAEGTRRNYRAMLMRISEVVAPAEHPDSLTPLSRKRIATPYAPPEMSQFRFWAVGQQTAQKRYRARLMLVLCAGAGLRPSDIAHLYKRDVVIDDRGVLVNVRGDRPRIVPLLREWEAWMLPLLDEADDEHPLWGEPNRRDRSNLLSSFTQYTAGTYPRGDRLRATWLVHHLQAGTPIKELLRAAGFDKFENLPRYLEFVTSLEVDEYRAALRGQGEL
ncbi:tyrosine-type recombinase/integrase [Leifsonia sp. NPDC058230]|uniref:tyrosine-type recombinase/integrase n=1 Tax=Leifsonia sp. NPDC058230 TaxID=3346391 RepID=UPI0036D81C89